MGDLIMSNSGNGSEKRENIFEILDGIMFQMGNTKKIFMIMILTTLILPPLALLVMTSVFDSPFDEKLDVRLQIHLSNGDITEEEYENIKSKVIDRGRTNLFLNPPQLIIFAISLVWLGVGVRQWFVLSKWDKKYERFKAKQADIDKKLSDDSAEE
ncbi:hypothetical protein C5F49_02455 [Nitrosopumilus oxyclinae]|uniref:Uncharacterized protein n=2 Tax=Nitrosopumilus oxyclinae TaxID=1959104 RepID=A0A7D5RAH9_9ARCH|nr:hypothetical protein C5F49_02455 [Nitrosopumilus oxyclinae]